MALERWLWKTQGIRIRGGEPSKLGLSTPYFVRKQDIDRYLAAFDQYKKTAAQRSETASTSELSSPAGAPVGV